MTSLCKKALFASIPFIAICLVIVCPAQAATFCVSNATALQSALTQAASNGEDDLIKIQQGLYVGNFVYASYEANAITIEGGYTSGCASRTIDPTNTVLDGVRAGSVLVISTDKATSAKIDGLTFQKGVASNDYGGGVYFKTDAGNFEVHGCVFTGNSAKFGGGVCVFSEILTLTKNTFTGNSASQDGGGACAFSEILTLINNTFTGNSASSWGGGMYAQAEYDGTITLTNNTFTGNSAKFGGGVCAYGYSGTLTLTLTLTNNAFTGNSAINGGGVYAAAQFYMTFTLTQNTFTENSASYSGGGLIAGTNRTLTLTLTNNTFTENSARYGGGACPSLVHGTLTLTNNTFYANRAISEGGAIRAWLYSDSIARIYNNIIWMNVAPEGADLWIDNDGDENFLSSSLELFNNDFDQSTAGTWIKIPFPIDPSNLDKADPLFMDAANGDLHLYSGSRCIDAGKNDAPELPPTDKEGNLRILGGTVDMGAYEYQEILYVEPEGLCGGKLPCYTSIHEAIAASGCTAILNIAGGPYDEGLICDQAKHLTLRGGWTSDFLNRDSFTTVNSITISGGTIAPDKIVLE